MSKQHLCKDIVCKFEESWIRTTGDMSNQISSRSHGQVSRVTRIRAREKWKILGTFPTVCQIKTFFYEKLKTYSNIQRLSLP